MTVSVVVFLLEVKAVVERFDVARVPRAARRNIGNAGLAVAEPLQRLGNQLRSIIHPQHFRPPAGSGEGLLEFGDQSLGGGRTLDHVQRRAASVRRSSTR